MFNLVRYDPCEPLSGHLFRNRPLASALSRLMDDEDRVFVPSVDLSEDENNYFIEADLPGFSREDVKIDLENGKLSIRAEHDEEKEEKQGNYHLKERRCGCFARSFLLPENVDQDKIQAESKDGVLTVTIPKAEAAKPRRIEVTAN